MQENKYVTIRNGVWISLYRRVDQSHTSRTPALQPFIFICIRRTFFRPLRTHVLWTFQFFDPFRPVGRITYLLSYYVEDKRELIDNEA